MFYLALEYFISYLPCVLLPSRQSSAPLDDRQCAAALIQQTADKRLAEKFL